MNDHLDALLTLLTGASKHSHPNVFSYVLEVVGRLPLADYQPCDVVFTNALADMGLKHSVLVRNSRDGGRWFAFDVDNSASGKDWIAIVQVVRRDAEHDCYRADLVALYDRFNGAQAYAFSYELEFELFDEKGIAAVREYVNDVYRYVKGWNCV